MSRKTRRRRGGGAPASQATVRAHIQGRKIIGIRRVSVLQQGEFHYGGYVYQIKDFPPQGTINISTTDVPPLRLFEGKYTRGKCKGKETMYKISYVAKVYSNAQECPDVTG